MILSYLPKEIAQCAKTALENYHIHEIRLRCNLPVMFLGNGITLFACRGNQLRTEPEDALIFHSEQAEELLAALCHYSVYSYQESLNACFLTLPGGSRVGVAAKATLKGERVYSVKDISSFNFRISRQVKGCAASIFSSFKIPETTLLIGPPGSGKTTLLRDACRFLSSGELGRYYQCTVVDERGEIAAMKNKASAFDLGLNTDVLTGFPKALGILNALRVLSPDWIIADEIGTLDEAKSICEGFNSGCRFLLSIHAGSIEAALKKPQLQPLLESGEIKHCVLLSGAQQPGKIREIRSL